MHAAAQIQNGQRSSYLVGESDEALRHCLEQCMAVTRSCAVISRPASFQPPVSSCVSHALPTKSISVACPWRSTQTIVIAMACPRSCVGDACGVCAVRFGAQTATRPENCGQCTAAALDFHRAALLDISQRSKSLSDELQRRLQSPANSSGDALRSRLCAVRASRAAATSLRAVMERQLQDIVQQRIVTPIAPPPSRPSPAMALEGDVSSLVAIERARLVQQLLQAMPLSDLPASLHVPADCSAEQDANLGSVLRFLSLLSSLTERPLLLCGVLRCSRSTVWRSGGGGELPLYNTESSATHLTAQAVALLRNSVLSLAAPSLQKEASPLQALTAFCTSVTGGVQAVQPVKRSLGGAGDGAVGWECL